MSVVDLLKKKKLQSLEKSEKGREYWENQTKQHAEHTKQILSGKDQNTGVPMKVVSLRNLYYHMLEDYTQKRQIFHQQMNKRSIALWSRVEKARETAECSQEYFLKAQFDWFHRTFGTAPNVEQLATDGAVERALEYNGNINRRVVGNNTEYKSSTAEVFKQNEKLVQQVLKAQNCTREEFYERFVLTGIYTFPKEFLNADPVYKKVIRARQSQD